MLKRPVAYEIQTTNRCNGGCLVCPHRNIEQKYQSMDRLLFKKIVDEIAVSKEPVRIVLYLNGEPFLDEYFPWRLQYTRETCPHALIEVSTNLSFLNEDILEAIKQWDIDDFRISCFGLSKETYEQIMQGLKYETFQTNLEKLLVFRKRYAQLRNVSLTVLDLPELQAGERELARRFCQENHMTLNFWGYLDRAGNVKYHSNHVSVTVEEEEKKVYTCAQNRHMERMHILVDGTVILCCQDWRRENVLGSVETDSLHDIWAGKSYEKVRRQIDQPGYPYPELCKKCKILLEGKRQ